MPDMKWKGEMSSQLCPLVGCYVPDFVHHSQCLFTKLLVSVFAGTLKTAL